MGHGLARLGCGPHPTFEVGVDDSEHRLREIAYEDVHKIGIHVAPEGASRVIALYFADALGEFNSLFQPGNKLFKSCRIKLSAFRQEFGPPNTYPENSICEAVTHLGCIEITE